MESNIINQGLEEISEVRHYVSNLTEKSPVIALGAAFGAGLLLSMVGIRRIVTAGLWLKTQGLLPSLKSLQASELPVVRH